MKAKFQENDGGREAAGYKGHAGDCTVRAIAIATEQSYTKVYEELFELNRTSNPKGKRTKHLKASPRDGGTTTKTIRKYMKDLGWTWTPTMTIGSGCKVHLKASELPSGRIIARVSKHMVALIDGVINDTYNPDRDGTRAVYGYYSK